MGSRCSRAWLFRIASNLSNLWIDRGRALQPEPEPDPEFRAECTVGPRALRVAAQAATENALPSRKSGSPEDTDLDRTSLGGPRIKHLRELFVIEGGARSRSRTLFVLSACEYRGG